MFKRICAATAALMAVAAVPAAATNPAGTAHGGSAGYLRGGAQVAVLALAPCAVDGQTSNSVGLTTANGIRWGEAASTCTTTVVDPDNDLTTTLSKTTAKNFELSALTTALGPRIKIASYTVTCSADVDGTSAGWSFTGMSGIAALPNPVPQNYVREVRTLTGTLLATLTFNNVSFPEPNDGSIALTMLAVSFEPGSGISGEVRVGRVACSPTV